MDGYRNMRESAERVAEDVDPCKNELGVRRFCLRQKLGISELWKRAMEHTKRISGSETDPKLFDFGEEGRLYYATVVDAAGNKYRYYCERK